MSTKDTTRTVRLGLRENWKQFTLLVIINAFVGAMVGLERSVLPELAEEIFQISANTAILSFIVAFGISKAVMNYFTGRLANSWGRKNLLIIGWIITLPVPLLLIYAEQWTWVIVANILLGISQGLTWSTTVIMKIDLVGEKNRGLAMGFNESAGYLAVGAVAFLTGWLAGEFGIRPWPFYPGLAFAAAGLILSVLLVRDTRHHVSLESKDTELKHRKNIFWQSTWKDPNLGSITQAGLVNNLNDGMMWGLFPVLLASRGFDLVWIGRIVAIYPMVWGLGQLITGKLADLWVRKKMLFWGMLMQGFAIAGMVLASNPVMYILLSILLGIGTATVYPTFLAAIGDYTHPGQRAGSIGIFRLWRDLGYAVGALLTGIIADSFSVAWAIGATGILTVLSAVILQLRMTTGNH